MGLEQYGSKSSFSRLADRIIQCAPSAGGKSQGEGSILGGLGRMMDGD